MATATPPTAIYPGTHRDVEGFVTAFAGEGHDGNYYGGQDEAAAVAQLKAAYGSNHPQVRDYESRYFMDGLASGRIGSYEQAQRIARNEGIAGVAGYAGAFFDTKNSDAAGVGGINALVQLHHELTAGAMSEEDQAQAQALVNQLALSAGVPLVIGGVPLSLTQAVMALQAKFMVSDTGQATMGAASGLMQNAGAWMMSSSIGSSLMSGADVALKSVGLDSPVMVGLAALGAFYAWRTSKADETGDAGPALPKYSTDSYRYRRANVGAAVGTSSGLIQPETRANPHALTGQMGANVAQGEAMLKAGQLAGAGQMARASAMGGELPSTDPAEVGATAAAAARYATSWLPMA